MGFESGHIDVKTNYEIINRPEIQNIINTVQLNNYSTDYAIRYVVVNVSRLVKRDISFFSSSEDERAEQILTKTYGEYPNIICKTLSELIRDILDILGIKSIVVKATNSNVPLYALIVDGEKGRYFIDTLYDLFRTQYRIKPLNYGFHIKSNNSIIDYKEHHLIDLSQDFIREMDSDMGLNGGRKNRLSPDFIQKTATDELVDDKSYFGDYIKLIETTFRDRNKLKQLLFNENDSDKDNHYKLLQEKIKYISDNLLNVFQVEGPEERKELHVYLRNTLYNRLERLNFIVSNRQDKVGNPVNIKIRYGKHMLEFEEVRENTGEDIKYSLKKTLEMQLK